VRPSRAHARRLGPTGCGQAYRETGAGIGRIISTSEPIRVLAEGYGAIWDRPKGPSGEGRRLIFLSDINATAASNTAPGQALRCSRKAQPRNGLTRDIRGGSSPASRGQRVTRLEADGSITVIANNYQGKRLARRTMSSSKFDGSIYFTDPGGGATGLLGGQRSGTIASRPISAASCSWPTIFSRPMDSPFRPTKACSIVDDSRRRHIRPSILAHRGSRQTDRSRLRRFERPERRARRHEGRYGRQCLFRWLGRAMIMDKAARIGRIIHGGPNTTNIAFGGDDWKTLYFTSRNFLGSVNVKVAGVPVPARKR